MKLWILTALCILSLAPLAFRPWIGADSAKAYHAPVKSLAAPPAGTHLESALDFLRTNLRKGPVRHSGHPQAALAFVEQNLLIQPFEEGEKPEAALLTCHEGSGAEMEAREEIFQGQTEKGDSLEKILGECVSGPVRHYVEAAAGAASIGSLPEGSPYLVATDPLTGRIRRFECEINDSRRLVIEGVAKPLARLEKIENSLVLASLSGVVKDSLFQAVADIGEEPQLAMRLINLFGSEINFIKDLKEGDSFRVLVEKRLRDGRFTNYGRLMAARFSNGGKTWEAFLFYDAFGWPQYYNAKGENLRKSLLRAPLAVTRLTSSFSMNRMHPILGFSRPHLGVDYGAPIGTPVKAVGDGVIKYAGWNGGYGKQIVVRHDGGLDSLYSHLAGFARDMREGVTVRQGQVIGFVGSTGLSTGPHLDFRLRQKGEFINPARAINPRAAPVPRKERKRFARIVEMERAMLAGRPPMENYAQNSIIAPAKIIPEPADEIYRPDGRAWRAHRLPINPRMISKAQREALRKQLRARIAKKILRMREREEARGGDKARAWHVFK